MFTKAELLGYLDYCRGRVRRTLDGLTEVRRVRLGSGGSVMSIVKRTKQTGEPRYYVRFRGPDGKTRNKVFRTLREAEAYERAQRTARDRGAWTDPRAGRKLLKDYAAEWLAARTVRGRPLAPRSIESYQYLLDQYILPTFGNVAMSHVSPEAVRAWYRELFQSAPPSVPPKAYRVLHAMFVTAVDDRLVGATPCRIKGGGSERIEERPVVTPEQVAALVEAIEPRWRTMILLAAYGQLRFGDLIGLRRRDVDLRRHTVMVQSQLIEPEKGVQQRTDPKSEAGRRMVTLPAFVVDELRHHLVTYVPAEVDAPIFAGARGGLPRRRNWSRTWARARGAAGVPDRVHLHDLRHMGATLAAQNGGTTKELMARLGHSTSKAALIYQHAVEERDHAIALALDEIGRRASERALPRENRAKRA